MFTMLDVFQRLEKYSDPRTQNYLLLSTPWVPIFTLVFYWLIVFKIGPSVMKNKQPLNITWILIFYNILQTVSNGFVFLYWGLPLMKDLQFSCIPSTPDNDVHLQAHYIYTLLKFLDLLDTMFFLLRKKYNQITFLHVHHHSGILLATWISNKYFPGGHAIFVGLVNTFVHTLMYFYYLQTCWNSTYKSIWWKQYLTLIQILQHFFIAATFLAQILNPHCNYPKFWSFLFWINAVWLSIQFCQFYYKLYIKKDKVKDSE